jgi:hypothetical protein
MNQPILSTAELFFKLLMTKLIIARHQIMGKLLNVSIWSFCTLVIFGHVMPAMGMPAGFAIVQFAGVLGSAGMFENYGNIATIIMDIAGERSIGYYLTLPVRPWVILLSTASSYALVGIALTIAMIPLGKLILFSSLSLATVAWGKLLTIIILGNLFYGMLAIAIAGHVGEVSKIGNVWSRFIFPLWFFGGFQFNWQAMNKASALCSYAILANPMLYVMEGLKIAVLGQEGHLPWIACLGALTAMTIICWLLAYNRMKKRLDFV